MTRVLFPSGVSIAGDALPDGRCDALQENDAHATPHVLIHGIDMSHRLRPRAVRSLLHHHMARLQVELYAQPSIRRGLVVVTTSHDMGEIDDSVYAAAGIVARRHELMRGRCVGIVALILDGGAPDGALSARIVDGLTAMPEGIAVLHPEDLEDRSIRAAVYAQRV